MNLQQIIAELENIIDQASDDDGISKESMLDALTDVVRDAKGADSLDFNFIHIKRCSNSWWYIGNNNLVYKGERCQQKVKN